MSEHPTNFPPGPRLPASLQLLRWYWGLPGFIESCSSQFGDTFTIRMPVFGTFVVFSKPEDVQQILKMPSENFDNGGPYSIFSSSFGPLSTIAATGVEHRRGRRVLGRPFNGDFAPRGETIHAAVRYFVQEHPDGHPIPLHTLMEQITLSVIAKATLGLDPGAEMVVLLKKLRKIRNPMYYALRRRFLPWLGISGGRRQIFSWIDHQIATRRKFNEKTKSDEKDGDALDHLLNSQGPDGKPISDEAIRADMLLLLMAGHGTTSTSLGWALLLILQHPKVLARIQSELADRADFTQAEGFKYLDATIMETLRMRPVAPLIFRRLLAPMEIAGYSLPKGVTLAPCAQLLHQREDVYQDPTAFKPERFLEGSVDHSKWLTFGGGFRRCLAAKFAQYEMRVVLATLLVDFHVSLADQDEKGAMRQTGRFIFSHARDIMVLCHQNNNGP
ncbi:MAG: cytochrome P450 [Planctomycetaceae bacterium]|nr:cytochrome P450 [Planctomycetaceae bacterium]